jgi:hypothetical protein
MDVAAALVRTLQRVESSEASDPDDSVEDIARGLRRAIAALESGEPVDPSSLGFLFAPTGSLQDLAIYNGWGEEFLVLAEVIDRYLSQ